MLDGISGFRARFDQINLIQELLDELPQKLGLQPAMPAFLLPYYNGVVPEDCGISAFLFLAGGHLTLHTFSFREFYFADLLSFKPFDQRKFAELLDFAFPASSTTLHFASREKGTFNDKQPDNRSDFGPHIMFEIEGYRGITEMEALFSVFDRFPSQVNMTPIMRPYIIKTPLPGSGSITSVMTMIAESHISFHLFHEQRRAYLDLFSCSFFNPSVVEKKVFDLFKGDLQKSALIPRGTNFRKLSNQRNIELKQSRSWLKVIEYQKLNT
jgi:S-adenosylmethionine/arginine decarboxylase-like enzyme